MDVLDQELSDERVYYIDLDLACWSEVGGRGQEIWEFIVFLFKLK